MTYLKALAVGVVTGIFVAGLYFAVALGVSLARGITSVHGAGSGGIGAISGGVNSTSVLVAGLLGLVVGVRRTLRLARSSDTSSSSQSGSNRRP